MESVLPRVASAVFRMGCAVSSTTIVADAPIVNPTLIFAVWSISRGNAFTFSRVKPFASSVRV